MKNASKKTEGIFGITKDGVIVFVGECKSCSSGEHSFIITRYLKSEVNKDALVKLQCVVCGNKEDKTIEG